MAKIRKTIPLTFGRLRYFFQYNPETGEFIWKIPRGRATVGTIAGRVSKATGYREIRIDGHTYLAQRLAWFYQTGEWPQFQIDHKNTFRDDNTWENLRPADHSLNGANKRPTKSRSGIKGVHVIRGGKFVAQIKVRGFHRTIGVFRTKEEAAMAYSDAAHAAFGEYARVS